MFLRISALFLLSISFLSAAGNGGDGILAILNGEAITYFDVLSYNRYNEVRLANHFSGQQLKKQLLESRKTATRRLVDEKILLKEFQEKGYQIPEFLIEERIDELIKEQSGGDRNAFKKYLRENDMSWSEYKESLKERVAVRMMLSQFVYSSIKITEDDIKAFIIKNRKQLEGTAKTNLALLMLKKNGKYADNLQQTAEQISKEIVAGTPFADLVQKYSEGPATSKGGDLGWIDDTNIRKECQKDIAGLRANQTTPPITLDEGNIAIFKVLARKSPRDIWSSDEVRKLAEEGARRIKQDIKYEKYMKSLRTKYVIKELF